MADTGSEQPHGDGEVIDKGRRRVVKGLAALFIGGGGVALESLAFNGTINNARSIFDFVRGLMGEDEQPEPTPSEKIFQRAFALGNDVSTLLASTNVDRKGGAMFKAGNSRVYVVRMGGDRFDIYHGDGSQELILMSRGTGLLTIDYGHWTAEQLRHGEVDETSAGQPTYMRVTYGLDGKGEVRDLVANPGSPDITDPTAVESTIGKLMDFEAGVLGAAANGSRVPDSPQWG